MDSSAFHLRCALALVGAVLLLGSVPSATAADAAVPAIVATGSITGRVQNVVIGRYLTNVRVSVKGTDLVASTDEFGQNAIESRVGVRGMTRF